MMELNVAASMCIYKQSIFYSEMVESTSESGAFPL